MQALDDIIILDLTHHIAGPYATKLFADLGANVIKIEKPGGDIARHLGPFHGRVRTPKRVACSSTSTATNGRSCSI